VLVGPVISCSRVRRRNGRLQQQYVRPGGTSSSPHAAGRNGIVVSCVGRKFAEGRQRPGGSLQRATGAGPWSRPGNFARSITNSTGTPQRLCSASMALRSWARSSECFRHSRGIRPVVRQERVRPDQRSDVLRAILSGLRDGDTLASQDHRLRLREGDFEDTSPCPTSQGGDFVALSFE